VEGEQEALEKHEAALRKLLEQAGISSAEQWHAMAEQAKEYQEICAKRSDLEERLQASLRDQKIEELEADVEGDGELPPAPKLPRGQLKAEIAALTELIDERVKEDQALHTKMTDVALRGRPVNELEEALARVEGQVKDLEWEHEATSHAMALIEEAARDKYARIAPILAKRSGELLAEITGHAYEEIVLGRDLSVSVRVPESGQLLDAPEKSLSKGTLDQVYLALRLALVQSVSAEGESIPMLLDDPFANYDDARLERSLRLVLRLSESNQIVLFTCREDVARVAQQAGAPVLRL